MRAAEYGVPIFRVASSGISQAIRDTGLVIAQTKFQVNGDILAAKLRLPPKRHAPLRPLAGSHLCGHNRHRHCNLIVNDLEQKTRNQKKLKRDGRVFFS
jgi:hypothetical protein